jgi:hypothetical protein
LVDAVVDVAGDADVEGAGWASHDVGVAGFHFGMSLVELFLWRYARDHICSLEWFCGRRVRAVVVNTIHRGPSTARCALRSG